MNKFKLFLTQKKFGALFSIITFIASLMMFYISFTSIFLFVKIIGLISSICFMISSIYTIYFNFKNL
ncbi:hypothetical protein C6V92_12100 [Clostridium perfringens]|nr:integral membrane protein [Clostridium perfringens C str. JGS1495]MDG6878209.1 hypothetical protein [Clostridium perfringens]MDH5062038.1 hypothetical protein [Clostridium perfringens NCTC 8239]MDG6880828.1 hypothetical protein [Clostridium perfringens]MDG6885392.1 hypothetical protein [Clostridium perfringens]